MDQRKPRHLCLSFVLVIFLTGIWDSFKCCFFLSKITFAFLWNPAELHSWPLACRIFTSKIIGNSPSHVSADRLDHSGRKLVPSQQRPIPSIGQWGYPHEGGRFISNCRAEWCLCYLNHVFFSFPHVSRATHPPSPVEPVVDPCRSWCSSSPSLAAFAKCLHGVFFLRSGYPRIAPNCSFVADQPIWPPTPW